MEPSSQATAQDRRLYRLVAAGWVSAVLAVYLGSYHHWVAPLQFWQALTTAIPSLSIGDHFRSLGLRRISDGLIVGLILVEAFGLGALALGCRRSGAPWLAGGYAVAIGLWMIAVAVLVLGVISTRLIPLAGLGVVAWFMPAPRKLVRSLGGRGEPLSGWERFLVGCLVVAFCLNLPGALTPPFEYDALEYHLGAPADYLRAGQIVYLPHNFYSNLPQLTEMLYLLGMTLGSDVTAKLLHTALGVLTAITIGVIGGRLGSRAVGLGAAALFFCTPFVQYLGQTARIDLATVFFATLALGGALLMEDPDQPADRSGGMWLVGLAAGGAVATKWTAIPVVVIPLLVYLAVRHRAWRALALVASGVLVGALPRLLKNGLRTGNPVYPLFSNWLPHPDWGPAQAAVFARKHYAGFAGGAWWDGLRRVWDYSFIEPGAVPLLLMTVPLLLFADREARGRRLARTGLVLFLLAWLGWYLFTFRPWRFLFPVFPLAALVGAWAITNSHPAVRCIVAGGLAVSLTMLGFGPLVPLDEGGASQAVLSPLTWTLGQVSREEFIERFNDGTYAPIIWMNQHLPADANVLYLGEARAYYAQHRVQWSTVYNRNLLQTAAGPGALAGQGVTHVYVNYSEWKRLATGYDYLADVNPWMLQRFFETQTRCLFSNDWSAVYQL